MGSSHQSHPHPGPYLRTRCEKQPIIKIDNYRIKKYPKATKATPAAILIAT